MIERTFDFQDQLAMSEGEIGNKRTEDIILSCFPTATTVEKASRDEDKHGTDYWVTTQSSHRYSVDVKVRDKDWCKNHPNEDDIALEVWSVVGKKVGWTRDLKKRTDYILWVWRDTGRWMLVPFPMLCDVFSKNWEEWCKRYKAPFQKNKGYSSQCVFVPRRLIWKELYDTFSGTPKNGQREILRNATRSATAFSPDDVKGVP